MKVPQSYLKFGGVSSLDFGLSIEEPKITRKPVPVVTRITVPGRGRDFLYSEGTFENVEISYQTWCADERDKDLILSKLGDLARWLAPGPYQVLSDTYDPDYFRLAVCLDPIDPELTARTHARQDLTFSCDPYRYSFAGNELQRFGAAANFLNTGWPTLPYLKIYGNGTITLTVRNIAPQGKETMWSAALDIDGFLELDSFEKDTTKNGLNQNARKTGEGYPVFGTGQIAVTVTDNGGYCSGLEIRPRWRTL